MAAPIDVSNASTLEQQAYEVSLAMLKAEELIPADNRPDNTQVGFDTEASTVAIAITLQSSLAITNGDAVISVLPYLP